MSWTFVPSLVGTMMLMFGVVSLTEGETTTGVMLLVLGTAAMALWGWMFKREGRGG